MRFSAQVALSCILSGLVSHRQHFSDKKRKVSVLVGAVSVTSFPDKESLQIAVNEWQVNPSAANEKYGWINLWDVSAVTDMASLFYYMDTFNDDISNWETSRVTTMDAMFGNQYSFNGDLSRWNTSAVTNMRSMFFNAYAFNGNISTWNTSSVVLMHYMFYNAKNFNGDLSMWDTSRVTNMEYAFRSAINFNRDISKWNTAAVTDMDYLFYDSAFNQQLCWNTTQASKTDMFYAAGVNAQLLPFPDCIPPPTNSPMSRPTSQPHANCQDMNESQFLYDVKTVDGQLKALMRSCRWLQRQTKSKREQLCKRHAFGCFPIATSVCAKTCGLCTPAY